MMFPTEYEDIVNRIDAVDPGAYGRSRNFIDGAVTRLSPYISRGVISTKQVFQTVLKKGYDPNHIEKFIQELIPVQIGKINKMSESCIGFIF